MSLPVFPVLPGLTYTSIKTPRFNTLNMESPNGYQVNIQQSINPLWSWTLIFDFLHDFFWGPQWAVVSELRTLMGFFNQMGGKAGTFLYTDPDDNSVGPALLTTGWAALTNYPIGYGILVSGHWQKVTAITTGISGSSAPSFSTSGGTVTDAGVTWTDEGSGYGSGIPNTFLAGLALVTDGLGNWFSPIQRTLDGVFYEDITDLNGSTAVYQNGTLASQGSFSGNYQIGGPGLATPTRSYMGLYAQWNVGVGYVAAWAAGHTYATNAEILDPSGHIQKATTGGVSGATIPFFNDSGSTTTDNTVTWTDQGYNPAPTGNISAAFNFYFRVQFDSDAQDFERWAGTGSATAFPPAGQGGGIWTIGGSEAQQGTGTLKLSSQRPVPL